jgi:hypothetical protein
MRRHVSLLRRMLHDYPARRWKIDIDGEEILDEYILWEAMNIRSVGPVLYLASQAATKDSRLDFVCVRGKDRSLFMKYLGARLAGRRAKFPLPLCRFRNAKIVWENSTLHFDSKVWPRKREKAKRPSDIEITVKPSALVILQPRRAEQKLGVIAGRLQSRPSYSQFKPSHCFRRDIACKKCHIIVTLARKINDELRITTRRNPGWQSSADLL